MSEKEKDFLLSLPPPARRWAQKTYFPVGIPSSQTTPNMCIERRDGLLTSHFWFADGTLVRQSEPETAIDFPMIRDGWYDLGGGYLGENPPARSEEHTSELQSLMRNSYDAFCLKKKKQTITIHIDTTLVCKY